MGVLDHSHCDSIAPVAFKSFWHGGGTRRTLFLWTAWCTSPWANTFRPPRACAGLPFSSPRLPVSPSPRGRLQACDEIAAAVPLCSEVDFYLGLILTDFPGDSVAAASFSSRHSSWWCHADRHVVCDVVAKLPSGRICAQEALHVRVPHRPIDLRAGGRL